MLHDGDVQGVTRRLRGRELVPRRRELALQRVALDDRGGVLGLERGVSRVHVLLHVLVVDGVRVRLGFHARELGLERGEAGVHDGRHDRRTGGRAATTSVLVLREGRSISNDFVEPAREQREFSIETERRRGLDDRPPVARCRSLSRARDLRVVARAPRAARRSDGERRHSIERRPDGGAATAAERRVVDRVAARSRRVESSIAIMVLLENDAFLTGLTQLYERNRASGSVWVTMKRSMMRKLPKRNAPNAPTPEEVMDRDGEVWVTLVRATDGKRKISTTVTKNKAEKFAKSLNTIQRAFIELQEDDAKKKKKAKAGAGGKKQKA